MKFTVDQTRRLRLRVQWLAPRPTGKQATVAAVVGHLVGVQAQDAAAAALSVRPRLEGATEDAVARALAEERSVVRTWCLRSTLHLVAAEDVGWLLALLGPVFIRAGRGRRAQLGLDEETGRRGVRLLCDVLGEHGPLTRAEIVDRLAARGLRLAGQARPHLIGLASLAGEVVQGPPRGREPTYVRLRDWIEPGPALPPEQARAELARRYLAAFAPAAPEDFAAWSGLALGEARAAWAALGSQLVEAQGGSGPLWLLKPQARQAVPAAPRRPSVRLLPAFDTFMLGYRQRDWLIAPEHARRIYPGGGLIHPAVLVSGRAAGAWRLKRLKDRVEVVVAPFDGLPAEAGPGLQAEAEAVGAFLGVPAALKVEG